MSFLQPVLIDPDKNHYQPVGIDPDVTTQKPEVVYQPVLIVPDTPKVVY